MLPRQEWRRHVAEVLNATVRHRSVPWSSYAGYGGPWIENVFIRRFLEGVAPRSESPAAARSGRTGRLRRRRLGGDVPATPIDDAVLARLEGTFYPAVPLFSQWTDAAFGSDRTMHQPNKELFEHAGNPAGSPLRQNVLYVALTQHDRGEAASGLPCSHYANVLSFSAGGWGSVAVPLIKGSEGHLAAELGPQAWPGRARSRLFTFVGTNHLGRDVVLAAFRSGTLPNNGNIPYFESTHTPDWRSAARASVMALAPRGYGRTSFRLYETLQYGLVPVYLYDDVAWAPYAHYADFLPPQNGTSTASGAAAAAAAAVGVPGGPTPLLPERLTGGDSALDVRRFGAVLQQAGGSAPLTDADVAAFRGSAEGRAGLLSGPGPHAVPAARIEREVLNDGGMWGPGGVGFAVAYTQVHAFLCVACDFLRPGSAARWRHVRTLPLHRYGPPSTSRDGTGAGGELECPCSAGAWDAVLSSLRGPAAAAAAAAHRDDDPQWVLPGDSLVAEMERRLASVGGEFFTYDGVMGQVAGFMASPLDSGLVCVPKPDTYGTPPGDPPFIEV